MKRSTVHLFSSITRASITLTLFCFVTGLWLLWAMLGPRTSEYFLATGDRELGRYIQAAEPLSPQSFPGPDRRPGNEEGDNKLIGEPKATAQEIRSRALGDAGTWGDSFGSLNALFAGLAFTGALAALFMQGQALEAQQMENHRQRFEETYFELLQLLRSARSEVRYRYSSAYRTARGISSSSKSAEVRLASDAFRAAMFEIRYWIERNPTRVKTRKGLARTYRARIHSRYESTFGPYFRLIYTILKRIDDDTTLTEVEKARYGNLLRSQLTSFEIALAAFNALMDEAKDLDELITEFRLLKYHPAGFIRNLLGEFYPERAFAGRDDDNPPLVLDLRHATAVISGGMIGLLGGFIVVWFIGLQLGGPTAVVLTLVGACASDLPALRVRRTNPKSAQVPSSSS